MKSRFSILKRTTAYVVIGCALSVVVTVTTSALYPALLVTGLLKSPLPYVDPSRVGLLKLQSGDVVEVGLYDDLIVSAAVFSRSGRNTATFRHSWVFSNDVLSRAYSQALVVASQTKLDERAEPGGMLLSFGLPFRSAYFQVSWYAPGDYGYLSGGINLLSSKPVLRSPLNVIIPSTLLWQGLVINALFWTGASFAAHWGIAFLSKRLRGSKGRSPRPVQHDGTMLRV